MDGFLSVFDKMPPLKGEKSPNFAALIGFLFGGLGLGIYFMSFIDFILPIVVTLVLTGTFLNGQNFQVGLWIGALFAAAYGYFRASNSNSRLQQKP